MNYESVANSLIELKELKKELTKIVWGMEDILDERSKNTFTESTNIKEEHHKLWVDLFNITYKIQDLITKEED